MVSTAIYDAEAGWYPTHEERIAIEDARGISQNDSESEESDCDESEESDYDGNRPAIKSVVPVRDPSPPLEPKETGAETRQANYDRDFDEICAQALREEASEEQRQNKLDGVSAKKETSKKRKADDGVNSQPSKVPKTTPEAQKAAEERQHTRADFANLEIPDQEDDDGLDYLFRDDDEHASQAEIEDNHANGEAESTAAAGMHNVPNRFTNTESKDTSARIQVEEHPSSGQGSGDGWDSPEGKAAEAAMWDVLSKAQDAEPTPASPQLQDGWEDPELSRAAEDEMREYLDNRADAESEETSSRLQVKEQHQPADDQQPIPAFSKDMSSHMPELAEKKASAKEAAKKKVADDKAADDKARADAKARQDWEEVRRKNVRRRQREKEHSEALAKTRDAARAQNTAIANESFERQATTRTAVAAPVPQISNAVLAPAATATFSSVMMATPNGTGQRNPAQQAPMHQATGSQPHSMQQPTASMSSTNLTTSILPTSSSSFAQHVINAPAAQQNGYEQRSMPVALIQHVRHSQADSAHSMTPMGMVPRTLTPPEDAEIQQNGLHQASLTAALMQYAAQRQYTGPASSVATTQHAASTRYAVPMQHAQHNPAGFANPTAPPCTIPSGHIPNANAGMQQATMRPSPPFTQWTYMRGIVGGQFLRFAVRGQERLVERRMENGTMAWCRVPAGNCLMTVPLMADPDHWR